MKALFVPFGLPSVAWVIVTLLKLRLATEGRRDNRTNKPYLFCYNQQWHLF